MRKIILSIYLISISILYVGCNKKIESTSNGENGIQNNYETESIDGTYYFNDNSTSLEITISGNSWTGKTIFKTGFGDTYDAEKAEYQNGIVKGKDLYDNSGYAKIGTINGNLINTSIGGNTVTLRK